MPDYSSDYIPVPSIQKHYAPLSDNGISIAKPDMNTFNSVIARVTQEAPDFVKNGELLIPYKTRLDETLRYTDPDIGFNPFDGRLEYKYADAHPVATFRNNIVSGGARFLGAALEAIGTIPIAINAASNKDFSKLYNNDFTNSIHDFLDTLNTELPTYRSEYEDEHPILKYLNPLKLGSFAGAWGGAVNNFGYTAGAIAGALVEDAVITALTGGAGLFPALAANATQIVRGLSRASKVVVESGAEVRHAMQLVKAADNSLEAVEGTLRGGVSAGRELALTGQAGKFATGTGMKGQSINNFAENIAATGVKKREQIIKNAYTYFKHFRDPAKYHLALLTSAAAEGAFEAADVRHNAEKELRQQFFDTYGHDASPEQLESFKRQAVEAANLTMGANIALLYLTNRLNWGSLFKPTKSALKEGIIGWGRNISRSKVTGVFDDKVGDFVYDVSKNVPSSRIGKVLLNGEKLLKIGAEKGLVESFEEGAQFTFSQGSVDYILNKYNADNRQQVGDYMSSFLKGINDTFNTNEGLDNLMGGFIGGIFGGAVMNRVIGRGSVKDQLNTQAKLMNRWNLKGSMEDKMQEVANTVKLAQDHKQAVEAKDTFAAKNFKFKMLFNWVASGVRANAYESRMSELDDVRGFTDDKFEKYWNVEYTPENIEYINNYLDGVKSKAAEIKKDVERVDYLTKNPYNRTKSPLDYNAYESYKDLLALNLSQSREYRRRMESVQNSLRNLAPGLDIQKAVYLTSLQGIRQTMDDIQSNIDQLGLQIKEAQGNEELVNSLYRKHQSLTDILRRLQPLVLNTKVSEEGETIESAFNGKEYVEALQDLFDLYNGIDLQNNKYIERKQKLLGEPNTIYIDGQKEATDSDKLADALEQLQDLRKLAEANFGVERYYHYLRTGKGADEFLKNIKNYATSQMEKIIDQTTGSIKPPEQVEEEVEEQIRFEQGFSQEAEDEIKDDENGSKEEKRENIRKAAKKVVKNQKLTSEEEDLAENHPTAFAHEVKIQQKVKKVIDELLNGVISEVLDSATSSNVSSNNVLTVHDVFGMFSQDKNDMTNRTNLYNAIFNSTDGVFNKIKAVFGLVEPENVVYTKIGKTELYRKSFEENLTITHNNIPIGILRPPTSVYLDAAGERSIFDLKEDEYEKITGNPKNTYSEFMNSLRAYRDSYNKLKAEIEEKQEAGGEVTYQDIAKYFSLSINTGSRKSNTNPANDVILRNLEYKPLGTALISVTLDTIEVKNGVSQKVSVPTIVNRSQLSAEQITELEKFLETNKDLISKNINRYAIVVPVLGKYVNKGIIFARNANTNNEEKTRFYNIIKEVASGVYNEDENKINELINNIASEFFLANTDRTTKQVFVNLLFDLDGNTVIHVFNNEKGVNKYINIPKEVVQKTQNYAELINAFNNEISKQESNDRTFASLKLTITQDSLKRQLPKDENITDLKQVEDKLQLAISNPQVFENFNINFTPIIGGANSGSVGTTPSPTEPTLPTDLSKSNPTYNYGSHHFDLEFETDIDKAAFISAQKTKSKRDADFVKFVMQHTNLTEEQVRELGRFIKEDIKHNAKLLIEVNNGESIISVDKTYDEFIKNQTKDEVEPEVVYVENKEELTFLLGKYFGLTQEQAEASADIFERVAQAWATRTGRPMEEFFQTLGFGDQELFNQNYKIGDPNTLFSKEQLTQIDKEVGELKEQGVKYPENRNLLEDIWYKTQTPTFKKWFGDSKAVDEYGDPIVYFHGTTENWEVFDKESAKLKSRGFRDQIYLTQEYDFANDYTKQNGNILSLFVKTSKPFDYENQEHLEDLKYNGPIGAYTDLETRLNDIKENNNWDILEDSRVQEFIKNQGYDGFYIKEQGIKNLAVYEPNQIKRLNSKGFDTNNDNINYQINDIQKIIKGFELQPVYSGSLFVGFRTKNDIANRTIVKAIYKWSKENDLNVIPRYNLTYGTIELVPVKSTGVLFQLNTWYGSPYNISRFSTSRVYTGEGQTVFGWGLYFTDLKGVAEHYANKLNWKNKFYKFNSLTIEELSKKSSGFHPMVAHFLTKVIANNPINNAALYSEYLKLKESKKINVSEKVDNQIKFLIENAKIDNNKKRNLYRVTLHKGKSPEQYTWLEWDKPISKSIKDKLKNKLRYSEHLSYYLSEDAAKNGEFIYRYLSNKLDGDKQASLFLLENGIDGVKYPAESISRGTTSDNARGFNYVVFDENAIEIEEHIVFQNAKAAYDKLKQIIYALTNPNVSSPIHELAHFWHGITEGKDKNTLLTDEEIKQVLEWAKTSEWTTETSEAFAKGFETYLAEGKAPSPELENVFQKFAKWLAEIYKDIKQALGIELNDNMRQIYARMLNSQFISDSVSATIDEANNIQKEENKSETPKETFDKNPYKLTPENNIDMRTSWVNDEETDYFIIDNNGKKLILKPYSSYTEAVEALNGINTLNGLEINEQPDVSKEEGSGVGVDAEAKNKALEDLVNLIPTVDLRRPNGSIGTQGFTEENMISVARFIANEMGFDIPTFDKNLGTSEIRQVIEYLKNNKETQQKIKEYVIKDPVVTSLLPDGTYEIEDGNHRANLLNLIGVDVIPTIELNGRDKQTSINEHNDKVRAVEQSLPTQEVKDNIKPTISKEQPEQTGEKLPKDITLEDIKQELSKYATVKTSPISGHLIVNDNVQLDINQVDGSWHIISITSLEKNKGYATKAMGAIVQAADNLNIVLQLEATPLDPSGLTKAQLVDFYKKFGFTVTTGQYGMDNEADILEYTLNSEREPVEMARLPIGLQETEKVEENVFSEPRALTQQEENFINTLKSNSSELKGIYSNVIKDMLDAEDYVGVVDLMRSQFVDDTSTAKSILGDTSYNAFLELTGVQDGSSNVDEILGSSPNIEDVVEPDIEEQPAQKSEAKYVFYKENVDGKIETNVGRVVSQEGVITTIERNGIQFDRLSDTLSPATEQEYKNSNPEEATETSKYKKGDKVVYGQDKGKYTITGSKQIKLEDNINHTFYTTEEGVDILESGIHGYARLEPVQRSLAVKREHETRRRILDRIGKRLQALFPQIKYEIGYFDFNAPARFNHGVVEINVGYGDRKYTQAEINALEDNDIFNVPWLKRESVAHEFMHPFIEAVKISNKPLYNNLAKEILNKADIMAHVDSLIKSGTYNESDRIDEAIAIFLGREITRAFDKSGIINREYIRNRKNNLVRRFLKWLNDVIDYITGRNKPYSLDEFIQKANTGVKYTEKNIRGVVNKKDKNGKFVYPDLDKLYKKHMDNSSFIRALNKELNILGNENFAEKYGITSKRDLDTLLTNIDDYITGNNKGNIIFGKRTNLKSTVEFEETDDNKLYVYIDPSGLNEISAPSFLTAFSNRIVDNELAKEYEKVINDNFYRKTKDKKDSKVMGVDALNPIMKLQDISDFLISQLDQDTASIESIEYTGYELSAIDELEKYMELSEPEAKKIRERVMRNWKGLQDIATKRLNNEDLKIQSNVIRRLDLDSQNDIEFVLRYTQQAAQAINLAVRKYGKLREELKSPGLTQAKLNRLNKELEVIKQLVSFYDEFNKLYSLYDESFNDADKIKFLKATSSLQYIRDSMANTAIDLTLEWLMPYIDKHNAELKKLGYSEKYMTTRQMMYNNLKFGTNKDTNFITFNLGTNVESRDPVNAAFANTISDNRSLQTLHIQNDTTELNIAYDNFLKENNISNVNYGAQIEFYKKHYYRQAEVLVFKIDEITGEKTEEYITKTALHQEFFFDKYEKDLNEVKKKYSNPRSGIEAEEFDTKIIEWQRANSFGKSEKYRNPEYHKLNSDKFFKVIENFYNINNAKYGENALNFGIIPQKYDANIIDKLQDFVKGVKAGKNVEEQYQFVKDKIVSSAAGMKKDNTSINLDGTVYRRIKTELTSMKQEKNISFDIKNVIEGFISEATDYSAMRDIQYNAETLRMLIEGNVKFSVPSRLIGKENFNARIKDDLTMGKVKSKFKELKDLKDAGLSYDKDLYEKLEEKIKKGVEKKSLWDDFLPRLKPSGTDMLNKMLIQQMNDFFYGDAVEDQKIGKISATKAAHYVSLYTSLVNMGLNWKAAISNINIGNLQLFIEGHGGKYFNKKELSEAIADYIKNIPNYARDLQVPIKSKDTQLAMLLDAIQGEVFDENRNRVTGSIAKRMFTVNNLFLLTNLGEHQIQITGMKAMLKGRKVETKNGEKITLYDAYTADKNGRYSLRTDLKDFTQEDLQKFIRELHGVNRNLNGNYSDLHKTTLARKWYGTLLLKFRKYLYPAFRSRFASEHIDYERNIVETGYLRFFFKDYLFGGLKRIIREHTIKGFSKEGFTEQEKYQFRKAVFELSSYAALSVLGMALGGGFSDDDKKKEISDFQKYLLYFTLRLRSDVGMYHVDMPSEFIRQIKNPTASLTAIVNGMGFIGQLWSPTEVYEKDSGTHEAGDSKLWAKAQKLIPVYNKFLVNIDDQLGYFNLINRNIEGVSPKRSTP